MKKSKVLVPALGILCLGMAAAVTGTVAWYSSNTRVSAIGMNVKAATSKNLVISTNNTLGQDEATVKSTLFGGVKTLNPASTQTLNELVGAPTFYKVTEGTKVDYSTGVPSGDAAVGAAAIFTTGSAGDVAKHTFYLRCDGASTDKFAKVYVSALTLTVIDPDSQDPSDPQPEKNNITKALRVGVVCGAKGYIFAPAYPDDGLPSYKGLKSTGTFSTAVSGDNVTLSTAGAETDLGQVVQNAYSEVNIYIWYEGQDSNCTSANSVNVQGISVSVSFDGVAA